MTEEEKRIAEANSGEVAWRLFGPYLSERQWGTVREDYSPDGKAWSYFPHDHARSRAYRWGEDGLAGISDDKQQLCFAIALWNGQDSILKERLFGLTNSEGNHGEDVKEYYFYLDNTPVHSYMKYLYKYPQQAFPYDELVENNRKRSRLDPEYELLDSAIFDEGRYFDIFVEYAKNSFDDLLIQITVENRAMEEAPLHLLPTLWFRNTWEENGLRPTLQKEKNHQIKATHPALGTYWLYSDKTSQLLFTDNETDTKRIFGIANSSPYLKDGFHKFLIQGDTSAVNPEACGTKAAVYHALQIGAQKKVTLRLRLASSSTLKDPLGDCFTEILSARKSEADAFYKRVTPFPIPDEMRSIQRQAFAGLLWNKQLYHYNVEKWLQGDVGQPPPPPSRKQGRNHKWGNLDGYEIFSMPDKWEYPWFAAWDLAFHTLTLALIDPHFAKNQLLLLTKEWYMHPNGQLPAYEWAFGDVNPPVHAWAALRIYQIENKIYGRKDRPFLEKIFQKLLLNFTWWVNRKDAKERNIFEGGFLGLDNISAFNRDQVHALGATLEQVDGTAWMGMFCLNLWQIALELASEDLVYQDMATKFFEHFVGIADAMNHHGGNFEGLWDEEKGFYYSLLQLKEGKTIKVDDDTLVGIIPLFAIASAPSEFIHLFPEFQKRFDWFKTNRSLLLDQILEEKDEQIMLSLVSPEKLKKILQKVLDENAFLSPHGIRSVSKDLAKNPFKLTLHGKEFLLDYEPAESTTPLFGGNSNWRGPIWFPPNYLLIESLQKFHHFLGDEFKLEYPSGSNHYCSLWDIATDLSFRLMKIFLKDEKGRRPVYGNIEKFQQDPHWKDYILFHEYFHGDSGAGLGASSQTGWTALVAKLIRQHGEYALK